MAWVKIDDGFMRHPKAHAAGLHGRALFISGLCWCAASRTDGRIPMSMIPMLAMEAGVKSTAAAAVADARLWHRPLEQCDSEFCPAYRSPVGREEFVVHDWFYYQPSRDEVDAKRFARAEAGRQGGLRSGETRRRSRPEANASSKPEANASALVEPQGLEPRPDPTHPIPSHPLAVVPTTTDDEMLPEGQSSSVVEDAALLYGYAQVAGSQRQIDSPRRFAQGVARNVLAEQGDRLHAYATEHPGAAAEQIAGAVLDLDRWALIGARRAMA